MLCGTGVPDQFEQCVERRYFSDIHYLALVCDEEVLRSRLRKRPGWRDGGADERIKEQVAFTGWLKDNAHKTSPPMSLLDITGLTVDESAAGVLRWVSNCLNGSVQTIQDPLRGSH
jgi:broad-specificity NMP kinase